MDILRKGRRLELELTQSDARGLRALLSNQPASCTPEEFTKAQQIYAWIFHEVGILAELPDKSPVKAGG